MNHFDRLPAVPLIANDPFFSIWMPADLPTEAETAHWAGQQKPICGTLSVDGVSKVFLGYSASDAAEITDLTVTPTQTHYTAVLNGVQLITNFWTPALPDDLDTLSTPASFVDFECVALDGKKHDVQVSLRVSTAICYDGVQYKEVHTDVFPVDGLNVCCAGQTNQNILGQSGDHITIDWGYFYMVSREAVSGDEFNAKMTWKVSVGDAAQKAFAVLGYDQVADINYFGVPCRSWYSRNGQTLLDALRSFAERHDDLLNACNAMDARVLSDAEKAGGKDYRKICAAAWRHTFAAHKLIATPSGEMAFLSKENDSNGCIGTVDVSYPSTPVMLRYAPELVNALCRPVLQFAKMRVWEDKDFAPHDVGRYPNVLGQVYALKKPLPNGKVYPPYYLYSKEADVYDDRYQMPVEECGNMLIMLESAVEFGADDGLAKAYMDTLRKWVVYLDRFGEDPGEQLCTDDFAGHLAHNINLSAKALVGVACFARLLARFGEQEETDKWQARAKEMAASWLERAKGDTATALTFDGKGWSMKYNLVWDRVLDLGLMPESFYREETASYLPRINRYGLPLDSRSTYTKSDWQCWCAAMAPDQAVKEAILQPIATYLQETASRVAFSDWYDTKNGRFVYFIARSVQGGVFMPMLTALER